MKQFETTGMFDESVMKEMKGHMIPDAERKVYMVLTGIFLFCMVISIFMKKYNLAFWSLVLAALDLFDLIYYRPKRYINLNLKRMNEVNGQGGYQLSSFFDENGMCFFNLTNKAEGAIRYANFCKIIETKHFFALCTKQKQFMVVFKEQLSDKDQERLLPFLKERCGKIKLVRVRA